MRPTLSTICSLDAPLEKILEEYSAGHCEAIDLWLGHAEAFLEKKSVNALKDCLSTNKIAPLAASFQGGLLTSQGDARREHWQHFETRIALLSELGVPVLVIAGDTMGPLGPEDLGRLSTSLSEAAKRAADAGLKLALEFDAKASFPNNLQSAVALVEDVGHPSLGLCLDWFHFTVGPSKALDLGLLSRENLAHVQLSDIADVPREMASDSERILPGEGSSPPDDLVRTLVAIGYTGSVSVEVYNPWLWRVPPRQFGEIAMTSLRRLLGLAAMQSDF
ncbi:MAG: sugar phosphate isomerase/epimerase [Planctomycetia bacterium]|nr:sugar phosphate isomerase/epimerase [Planctomycetia bacterium]